MVKSRGYHVLKEIIIAKVGNINGICGKQIRCNSQCLEGGLL